MNKLAISLLAVTATTALLAWTGTPPAPQQPQKSYPEASTRGNARIFYWGGNASAGQLAIDYGTPAWSEKLGAQLDSMIGKRWRLGQNFWTNLDTNIDLTIAGEEIAAGYYYLALEPRKDDQFVLVLLDPAEVRAKKLDSYHAHFTKGGIEIPMEYEEVDQSAGKLAMQLRVSNKNPDKASLEIRFGPHKLKTTIVMHPKLAK